MKALRDLAQNGFRSTIGKNIMSLYALQISYYILPLITIPYLVRVLGPEKFGIVSFGQSIIAFFVLAVSYGFDVTATRRISVQREDSKAVGQIASSVWAAKALIFVIGLLVLLLPALFVSKINEISLLLLILYGIALGNVLFPFWLFQGLERMGAISVINLAMRAASTAGVFIFISQPDDYLFYAGLISFQWVGAGFLGVCFALTGIKVPITVPSRQEVLRVLAEGRTIFLSLMAHSLYRSGNGFILGLLTNYTTVGYYSAAEKIVLSLLEMLNPIAQAVYPRFSKMASESKLLVLRWARRLLYIMAGLGAVLSAALFISAPLVVRTVLGPGYEPSIAVLQVLAILPLVVGVTYVLGMQLMLPFGRDKAFMLILFGAGFLNIVLATLTVPIWQESGMAVASVSSETFICVSMFFYLWCRQLNPFSYKTAKKGSQEPVSLLSN